MEPEPGADGPAEAEPEAEEGVLAGGGIGATAVGTEGLGGGAMLPVGVATFVCAAVTAAFKRLFSFCSSSCSLQ